MEKGAYATASPANHAVMLKVLGDVGFNPVFYCFFFAMAAARLLIATVKLGLSRIAWS